MSMSSDSRLSSSRFGARYCWHGCLGPQGLPGTPQHIGVLCCYRSPKNRKALQKVFSNDKPKLLGFVSKVRR